ncbi:MAG TPA: M48 family metalloprotease, partial [Candidatus Omnitrophota bacterium]|nr:M48 family metalloprotease [Candidatus Omnitrophota bacterium]
MSCFLLLTGCATYNTATERNEVILISTSSEVAMARSIHSQISSQNKIISNTDETRRLERIGVRVARVSDRQDYQYHFYLIDSDEINAFTVPGGNIYFYTGLLRRLPSDDQVASVLAHEVGHCAAKHTVKKFQAGMGYDLARNVLVNILALKAPGVQSVAGLSADAVMNLATSAYSRRDEYEADRLGIKYLYLAGFDLNGMIQAFDVLQEATK